MEQGCRLESGLTLLVTVEFRRDVHSWQPGHVGLAEPVKRGPREVLGKNSSLGHRGARDIPGEIGQAGQ